MRCCGKKKDRAQLLERLHSLARTRNTKAAIEMKNAMDEEKLAADCLRNGDKEQAREHAANANESKQKARHELALYQNATGLIQAIDRVEFNQHMAQLIQDGAENLDRIISETPDLEDLVVSFKTPKEQLQEPLLDLPDVPDRPLLRQSPPRIMLLSTE